MRRGISLKSPLREKDEVSNLFDSDAVEQFLVPKQAIVEKVTSPSGSEGHFLTIPDRRQTRVRTEASEGDFAHFEDHSLWNAPVLDNEHSCVMLCLELKNR